jgi:PPP family 3-phenylpropionic acid transporter
MKRLYKDLLVTTFFLSFATGIFVVFLPSYFEELGLSYVQIGIVLAFVNIVAAFGSLLVGYMEEEVDKIKILLSSYAGYAILPILYLSVGGFLSSVVVRVCDGIATSLRYVAEYSLLESKAAYRTGVNVSMNEALSNLGSLVGPLFAGALALYYGIDSVFALSFVVLLFVLLYGLRLLKFSKPRYNQRMNLASIFREEFSHKPLMVLSILFLLFSIVDASKFLGVTLYMKTLGFSSISIAIVGSSFFFFTFLFELFSGSIERKRIRNTLLTAGMLLCGISIFLFSVLPSTLLYMLLLAFLFSLGTALVRPAIFSDLVSVERAHPNIGTGIIFFFANSGAVIGLALSGLLIETSFNLFFIASGALLIVSSVVSLMALRNIFKKPQKNSAI